MKLYWAAAVNFGNRVELYKERVNSNDFSRHSDTFAIRPFYSDGAPGYVSHMAFGRTEEDAARNLDNLNWREYAADVRDSKYRAETIRSSTQRARQVKRGQ